MYRLVFRRLLFLLDAETAHRFTCFVLKTFHHIPFFGVLLKKYYCSGFPNLETNLMGIKFPNPVGLAAGFDKNAYLFNELSNFGFGFIEIGTVTPLPQYGNPKRRIFRLKKNNALINRIGFSNIGVLAVAKRLKKNGQRIIIGGNIGKNKNTPINQALNDYKYCFEHLFPVVDYFAINVSSPNTPLLRDLQNEEVLEQLLENLMQLNEKKKSPKPILVKIAPDITKEQLKKIITVVEKTNIAGIIASNTTTDRGNLVQREKNLHEIGGLSGSPLLKKSNEIIKFIAENRTRKFVIIGVGGIHSVDDAMKKINAGANLIQLYTGLVYEGPSLPKKILQNLSNISQNN